MLTSLAIRNIVLIEALDLAFGPGLGVLTGETGAGKSILLDALGLVLGNRAETGLVRAGEEQASVTATFEFVELPEPIRLALADAEVEIERLDQDDITDRERGQHGAAASLCDRPCLRNAAAKPVPCLKINLPRPPVLKNLLIKL